MTDHIIWTGEENRELQIFRPCDCGCDTRDGEHEDYAGYVTASDEEGNGFTFWIKDEEAFNLIVDQIAEGRE